MGEYTDIARRMEEGGICKAVVGDYVIYKRNWLYEHIDQECVLIKSAKELLNITQTDFNRLKAIRDDLTNWLKDNGK